MSFHKMNPETKKLWTDALRSGDYIQQRNALLHSNEGFCCLGVLCEITKVPSEYNEIGGYYQYNNDYAFPSDDIRNRPDIMLADSAAWQLTAMNDVGWYTFSNIADWIEENLLVMKLLSILNLALWIQRSSTNRLPL